MVPEEIAIQIAAIKKLKPENNVITEQVQMDPVRADAAAYANLMFAPRLVVASALPLIILVHREIA